VSVRLSEPRPDAKCVYTDANQVCWNKAKLRRAKANQANDQAVIIDIRSPAQDFRPTRTVANIVSKQER
jgi:hypothetical protein